MDVISDEERPDKILIYFKISKMRSE